MGDIVQFVDSISATPTVRLDLNNESPWALKYEGTDLSPPDLRRGIAQTLLSHGGLVTGAAWDNRMLRFRLELLATTPDVAATAIQALHRELNRPPIDATSGVNNIIRWQPGTSAPQFFLTMLSPVNKVTELPGSGGLKLVDVDVLAKPFALGLRETIGGTLNADTSFESGSLGGWTAQNGTVVPSTTFARTGSWSLRLTPAGGVSPAAFRSEMIPVVAGLPYQITVPMFSPTGYAAGCSGAIDWRNSSGGLISTTSGTQSALPANTWTVYQAQGIAPAGAVTMQFRARLSGGTPTASDVTYLDDPIAVQYLTVSADPAASINGCFFDVVGIKGDVETPLFLSVPDGSGLLVADRFSCRQSAIAVRRRGTPSQAPFVLQAESMTMASVDASVQPNSAVMSGSGSNFVRVSFATVASMATRISVPAGWPSTASVDVRGRYRVFMRYRSSTLSPGVLQARLRWGTSNVNTVNDTVGLITGYGGAGGPYMLYADLGDVQFPQGYDPVSDGPDGVELPVEGMYVAVDAARISGSASLDIDLLLFVPADDRHLLVAWPPSSSAVTVTLDSDRSQVYAETAAGAATGRGGAELDGLPPLVSPGVTNRVFFVRDVGQTSSTGSGALGDDITASTAISPYYFPRYLYTRPPSS